MDPSQLGKKILENAALSDGLMSRDCCYKSQMLESKFGIKNMKKMYPSVLFQLFMLVVV